MKKRVAIIGSGIAGMGSAWYLKGEYNLKLYEKKQLRRRSYKYGVHK